MPLSSIQTGIRPEPFRMLIHGTEGIGKSTFAAQAPKPIFIQTEDGLAQIDVPKFPLCENYEAVLDNLKALRDEKHDYMTAILDSVDWLEKLAGQHLLATTFKKNKGLAEVGYQQGFKMLVPLFEEVIDFLSEIRKKREMNIVLIAHTRIEKVEDPMGSSFDEYAPRLCKYVNGIVRDWPDIIGFATHAIRRTEEDEGFGRTRTVAKTVKTGGNDRILFLEQSPAIVAKCRYKLPPEMPLDGKNFFYSLWNLIHPKK